MTHIVVLLHILVLTHIVKIFNKSQLELIFLFVNHCSRLKSYRRWIYISPICYLFRRRVFSDKYAAGRTKPALESEPGLHVCDLVLLRFRIDYLFKFLEKSVVQLILFY